MGTRNAEERRKAAGKHRKESFSVKLEVVAKYEPQAK
ncbi:unknown [Ruminococcus sp. CAG:254]|nr:unknown [Ruminococcus sp. CAG:254]